MEIEIAILVAGVLIMVGGIVGGGAIYSGLVKLAEAIKKTKIDTFVEIGTCSYADGGKF